MISSSRPSIIALTLLLAILLSIMPLPISVDAFRPDWLLIVVLYWSLALPERVNVFTAWFMGILLDILLGSVLGIHAAAMAVAVFITSSNCQKIRNFSGLQQSLVIGVIIALYHLLVFWLQRTIDDVIFLPSYLYPVLTTIIVWRWAFLLLRKIRRQFNVT